MWVQKVRDYPVNISQKVSLDLRGSVGYQRVYHRVSNYVENVGNEGRTKESSGNEVVRRTLVGVYLIDVTLGIGFMKESPLG